MDRRLFLLSGLATWLPVARGQGASNAPFLETPLLRGEVVIDNVTNAAGLAGLRASFEVKATRDAVWNLLIDYPHYREIFQNVESLTVEEANAQGARVRFGIKAAWLHFDYTLQRDYDEPGRLLSWHRVGGDFKELVGTWTIGDGSDAQHLLVVCESFVDIGFLVPTALVRQGARTEMHASMLRMRQRLQAIRS